MPNETVLYKITNSVAHIILNRPDRYNSYNHDLTLGILQGLDNARRSDEVRVVLIYGSGPGYSAGADLKGVAPDPLEVAEYMPMYYGAIVKKIMTTEKPVISAIHGSVAGVAMGMALASDLRIMADTAQMKAPFVNIGLGPDGGVGWLLTRLVGYSRAFEILSSGQGIAASRCHEMGLTNRVVSEDMLMSEATQWAEELAQKAPLSMATIKKDLQHALTSGLYENIIYESENQRTTIGSEDFVEGVMAFLGKRKPQWKGK